MSTAGGALGGAQLSPAPAGLGMRRGGRLLVIVGWVAFLCVGLTLAHRLPTPALTPSGRAWSLRSLPRSDPAAAVIVLVRVVALALGWYLAFATVVALACRLVGWHAAAVAVEAASPRFVRRVLQVTVGVALLAAPAPAGAFHVVPGTAANASVADEAITMRLVRPPSRTSTAPTDATAVRPPLPAADREATTGSVVEQQPLDGETEVILMRRLADGTGDGAAADASADAAGTARAAPTTWTIEPGQHLWSIASQLVGEHLGRQALDDEVDPYWRRLVAANQHRLAVRDVPDLVYPGQVLEVPPVAATDG